MLEQGSPAVENKLDSILERLDMLCSTEDDRDTLQGDGEHEQWAKLFEWVAVIDSNS